MVLIAKAGLHWFHVLGFNIPHLCEGVGAIPAPPADKLAFLEDILATVVNAVEVGWWWCGCTFFFFFFVVFLFPSLCC